MERAGVGAADVHAGAAANGFEAFEDLDRARVVIVGDEGLAEDENRSDICL